MSGQKKSSANHKDIVRVIFKKLNGSIEYKDIESVIRIIIDELITDLADNNSIHVENFGTLTGITKSEYWFVRFYQHKNLTDFFISLGNGFFAKKFAKKNKS